MEIDRNTWEFGLSQIEDWLNGERETFRAHLSAALTLCESPIEQRMLAALAFCPMPAGAGGGRPLPGLRPSRPKPDAWESLGNDEGDCAWILPQQVVLGYRVDFMLVVRPSYVDRRVLIVVECDGHDFHERTKEQAQKDRSRDRALTAAGFQVFRFTGSEIFRDARRCAGEIGRYLWDLSQKGFDDGSA